MNYIQSCIVSFRRNLVKGFLAENCPQICKDVLKLCDEYEKIERENKELKQRVGELEKDIVWLNY